MAFESLEAAHLYAGLDDWVTLGAAVAIAHTELDTQDESVAVPAALHSIVTRVMMASSRSYAPARTA